MAAVANSDAATTSAESVAARAGGVPDPAIPADVDEALAEIRRVAGTAREGASAVEATRNEAKKSLDDLRKHAQRAKSAADAADAAKTAAEAEHQRAAQEVAAITAAKAEIDTAVTSAKQERDSLSAHTSAAAQMKGTLEATLAEAQKGQASVESLRKQSADDQAVTAALAKIANEMEVRLEKYEEAMEALQETSAERIEELTKKVESLLPGATSAGLAAAFEQRKNALVTKQTQWKVAFVAALLAISSIASWIVASHADATVVIEWPAFVQSLVPRLLLMGPFVWLAILSIRHFKTLSRLEEEYAHKEAVSRAFEGYKRETKDIGNAAGPALKLAELAIEVLGSSPVRLYEGKPGADSPVEAIVEASGQLLRSAEQLGKASRG